jgi:hypothetical protein
MIACRTTLVTLNLFQGPFLRIALVDEAGWMLKRVQHDVKGKVA